ncbi:Permease [Sporosarcina sp. ANT_H38]
MSDRFELSFKNKVVRMWLIIMVPTVIAEILLMQFNELTFLLSVISWTIFLIWHYFYKRKQKKEHSVT